MNSLWCTLRIFAGLMPYLICQSQRWLGLESWAPEAWAWSFVWGSQKGRSHFLWQTGLLKERGRALDSSRCCFKVRNAHGPSVSLYSSRHMKGEKTTCCLATAGASHCARWKKHLSHRSRALWHLDMVLGKVMNWIEIPRCSNVLCKCTSCVWVQGLGGRAKAKWSHKWRQHISRKMFSL